MPLFGYFAWVGAVLLAALFVVGDSDGSPAQRTPKSWAATDSPQHGSS